MSTYPAPLTTQLWTPWNLRSVLKAWWSVDDLTPGAVATWTDRISGIAPTAAGSTQPVMAAASFNGKPGVTFDGVDDLLFLNSVPAALPQGATGGDIWMLLQVTSVSGIRAYIAYGGTGGATLRNMFTNSAKAAVGEGATNLTDTTVLANNSYLILGGFWSGTTEGGRLNGRDFSPATTTIASLNTSNVRTRIGSTTNNTAQGAMVLRQVLITTTLTSAQRQQLEGWLAWDGGIPSVLPASHPYRNAAPGNGTGIPFKKPLTSAPRWSPWNIRNSLAAWWSADDPVAGAVATWTDRVGGLAVTATAGIQPIQAANSWTPNGKPGLTFDGIDDCFVATVFPTLPVGATAGEIWLLGIVTDFGANNRVAIAYGAGGAPNNRSMARDGNGSGGRPNVSDGTIILPNTIRYGSTAAGHIHGGYWSGTTEGGRFDGADFAPNATATISSLATTAVRLRIGAYNGAAAANFWQGIMRHVFITTLLTPAQRLQLEGWLAWDGGMQSQLPANHPYKNAPP